MFKYENISKYNFIKMLMIQYDGCILLKKNLLDFHSVVWDHTENINVYIAFLGAVYMECQIMQKVKPNNRKEKTTAVTNLVFN